MAYRTKDGLVFLKKEKNGGAGRKFFTFLAVGAVLVYCAYSISSDKKDVAALQYLFYKRGYS